MVERLKRAIEKARCERHSLADVAPQQERRHAVAPTQSLPAKVAPSWRTIPEARLDPQRLRDVRIAGLAGDPVLTRVFESLALRIRQVARQNSWRRISLTAPTSGCGTTTFTLNLALSMVRRSDARVLILDLNTERPMIARRLGVQLKQDQSEAFSDQVVGTCRLSRIGEKIILAGCPVHLNDKNYASPDDLFQNHLTRLEDALQPDVMLLDLPPLLEGDDAQLLLPLARATLLVASAERTTAPEIEECARLISSASSYLGTVLNKSREKVGRRVAHESA